MAIANQIVKIQLEAEKVFKAAIDPALKPRIGALAGVMSELGSTRINAVYSDDAKKKTVEVWYPKLNRAPGGNTDRNASCTPNYTAVDTQAVTYSVSRQKEEGFSIPMRAWETNPLEATAIAAEATLNEQKKLVEGLNGRVHSFLATPANLTPYDDGVYPIDGVDKIIEIPVAQRGPKIFSYMTRVANKLGMADPYIIFGGALWELYQDISLSKTDPTGESAARKASLIRGYGDYAMDATLSQEAWFLVDRGTLAIMDRPDFRNNTPKLLGGDRYAWMKEAIVANTPIGVGLDGAPVRLKMDNYYNLTCVNGNDTLEQYGFVLSADIVKAPTDTSTTAYVPGATGPYTGIVGFRFV